MLKGDVSGSLSLADSVAQAAQCIVTGIAGAGSAEKTLEMNETFLNIFDLLKNQLVYLSTLFREHINNHP